MKNFKSVASLASLGRLFHNFPALYTKLFSRERKRNRQTDRQTDRDIYLKVRQTIEKAYGKNSYSFLLFLSIIIQNDSKAIHLISLFILFNASLNDNYSSNA